MKKILIVWFLLLAHTASAKLVLFKSFTDSPWYTSIADPSVGFTVWNFGDGTPTWTVNNNKCGYPGAKLTTTSLAAWTFGVYGGAIYTYTDASVTICTDAGANEQGICFRFGTAANGAWANGYSFGYPDGTDLRVLKYTTIGGPSVLASSVSGNYSNGVVLRVVANGSNFTCYENGVQKFSFTDSSFASGSVGFISRQDVSTPGETDFFNLSVDDGNADLVPARGMPIGGIEQPQNGTAWGTRTVARALSAVDSARKGTYTCQPGTFRGACYGHSIPAGWTCSHVYDDGYRPYLLLGLAQRGISINFVGSFTRGTLIGCDNTDAVGGYQVSDTYASLSTLPNTLPSPATTDWVLLGPTLTNDATVGNTLSYMIAGMEACITRTASYSGLPTIYVCNDFPRNDGVDLTNALSAAHQAFTWAAGQGYKVREINLNSCVNTADLCSDNLHLTTTGNAKAGDCLAQEIINSH